MCAICDAQCRDENELQLHTYHTWNLSYQDSPSRYNGKSAVTQKVLVWQQVNKSSTVMSNEG